MADLIDRQAAIDAICNVCSIEGDFHKCDGYPEGSTWCEEITALRTVPSADAVEIVRCKDCKWFNETGCAITIVDESDKPHEHDFCSFAERRTDGWPN